MKNLHRFSLSSLIFACVSFWLLTAFPHQHFAQKPEIRAVGVTEDGKEVESPTLQVAKQNCRTVYALPSVIEFGTNSSQLPQSFVQLTPISTESFRIEYLAGEEFIESRVLNIIAYRMKAAPSEVLTLAENDNALPRSTAIKNYLQTAWKIAPERLVSKVKKQLPKDCNCVELSNDALLKPLELLDTFRVASPPILRFFSTVAPAEENSQQWSITIRQDSKPLRNPISAAGNIRPIVDWKTNKEKNSIPTTNSPLKYSLEVRYPTLPNQRSTINEIAVRQNSATTERFEMRLVFKANETDLNASNRAALAFFREKAFGEPVTTIIIKSYGQTVPQTSSPNTKEHEAQAKLLQQRLKSVEKAFGTVLEQGKYSGGVATDMNYSGRDKESVVFIAVERPLK